MTGKAVVHASGAARREVALAFARASRGPLFVVGARIESARSLVADLAIELGAIAEAEATTLDRLAAQLARPALARAGLSIATTLAIDTAAAQALTTLATTLPRMGPLRATPGMPRAIGRTLEELWAADLAAGSVAPFDAELAAVAAQVERTLAAEKLVSRARVLELAIEAVIAGAIAGARVVFLDVPIVTRLGGELARAIATAASTLFTVPRADARTLSRLVGIEISEPVASERARATAALAERLFSGTREATPTSTLETIVARGEAAESAEITRRVLAAAREGTPLHRIAIALRKPELARASIEAAFRAAGIPLAQRRGARRPDPSGRALLALLACANDGLSARSFSTYLSFGVLPRTESGEPPPTSANDAARVADDEEDESDDEGATPETVRAPRQWERLLVEAIVIGGDPQRWRRRIRGLSADLSRRAAELDRIGGESSGLRRTMDELAALERFALPLLDDLAALPARASLAVYREKVSALATRALAQPARALAAIAELAPRAPSGEELTLADLARVLAPRLGAMETRPASTGVQLVTPDELRGASYDLVIIPSLAERVFPARMPEDPLLPDGTRAALSPDLEDAHARAQNERLLLAIAVGAAERRVIALASIATADARARVPSVYFVELLAQSLGRVASGADVARAMARAVSVVGTAETAARSSERAIARARELSTLSREEARGRANDVVGRNPLLRTALARVHRREVERLGPSDGLVQSKAHARTPLLAHDPGKRPYSATALESFATCPLRFHLKSVLRLEPQEEPVRLEELDPLVRGSVTHEAQFLTLSALRDEGALPLSEDRLEATLATFTRVFTALRRDLVDRLVPAIPRVFHAELDAIEADLREWLTLLGRETAWRPQHFELAFGLPGHDEGRDPASRGAPAALDEGITLRGAIDLVEENVETGALRATDHKSGSNYPIRGRSSLVVRGGQTLQPVLYALALEKLFPGKPITGGRLWYCTTKGGFQERTVPLDDEARAAARELSQAITQALANGLLPALPLAGACGFCDYRRACGPGAARRADKIPRDNVLELLSGLVALRKRA